MKCKNCGSEKLSWHCGKRGTDGIQDGRFRMHEVHVTFFLGCDECSETLKYASGDEIASFLTDVHYSTQRNEGVG